MDSVQALFRRANQDAAVIDVVKRARQSMELIHRGEIRIGDYVIDLSDDIERLTGVLVLLGYPGEE